MMANLDGQASDGAVASREYDVQLPSGETGTIRFTLSDLQYSTGLVAYALQRGATACGLITMVGIPGGTSRPLVWIKSNRGLEIVPTGTVPEFSAQLRSTLSYCLLAFFTDVEAVRTQDAAVHLRKPVNDNA